MNYDHNYHAGNFADCVKHLQLILVLKKLLSKESPLFVLDTHAGWGQYHLTTEEATTGIHKLAASGITTGSIGEYLALLSKLGYPKIYSGSPKIINSLLRLQDQLVLLELHSAPYAKLQHFYKHVHLQDAYSGLKSLLPPKNFSRGLIFIDPPFEHKDEFKQIFTSLQLALTKFATATYMVWFPIKSDLNIAALWKQAKALPSKSIVLTQFLMSDSKVNLGLQGSGMLIINPPWGIIEQLHSTLAQLVPILSSVHGSYSLDSIG